MRFSAKILLAAILATGARADALPEIAIIIDDLGYDLAAGERAIRLPGPIACAVLPGTPRGRRLAVLAHERGKDVLLHLPLQSMQRDDTAEPGAITLDTSRSAFAEVFARDMLSVPHAIGVNNHRGSLLTRHPGHMGWLMEEITREGLFFVDSYTTHHSVALAIAREAGVPAVRRDVFLDADPAPESVAREFERLKRLARSRGAALAIGHPYPATLTFLEAALPGLEQEGFRLVGVRELVRPDRVLDERDPRLTAD